MTEAGVPPGPLREFWLSFSANRGGVDGTNGWSLRSGRSIS